MSEAMRLIEAAEAQTEEGQEHPPIVLLWQEYKALVAELDEAEATLLDVWRHNVSRGRVPLPADLVNRIADWARAVRERAG